MKINLSKKELKECCKLVKSRSYVSADYTSDLQYLYFGGTCIYLNKNIVSETRQILYMAFLQEVIEALEEKHMYRISICKVERDMYTLYIKPKIIVETDYAKHLSDRKEAKEEAIRYIFKERGGYL